ncbi:MAG: hypothetical protein ABW110_00330 [Steroidobacteraceae bacterium]
MRTAAPPPLVFACSSLLFLLAWGGIALGSFQYDDFANILTDPATFNLPELTERLMHGIRPLTRASYAASAQLFGEWTGGWLLVNGLLHALTTLGVGWLAFSRLRNHTAALAAGLCFALQPANAAVVAYVSGRSTGLATALLAFALLAHEQAVLRPAHAARWQFTAMLAFVCACMAKEIAVVFPALVFAWELTRPANARIAGQRAAPYAAFALLCLVFMLSIPRYRELLEFSLATRPPLTALFQNFAALPLTFSLWVRPWALAVEHAAPSHWAWSVAGLATVSITVFAAVRTRTSRSLLALALLWPVIAIAPTHSIIARLDAINEGALYLAWIGPSIGIGAWLGTRSQRALQMVTACMVSLALLCMWRVHVWSDPVLLWREAVANVPQSARAWTNLGMAHMNAQDRAAARGALRVALALDPTNPRILLNLEVLAALNPSRSTEPQ